MKQYIMLVRFISAFLLLIRRYKVRANENFIRFQHRKTAELFPHETRTKHGSTPARTHVYARAPGCVADFQNTVKCTYLSRDRRFDNAIHT